MFYRPLVISNGRIAQLPSGDSLVSTQEWANVDLFQTFNEVSSVPIGTEQTILSYTVPVGSTLVLLYVAIEGDSVGVLRVKEDGTTIAKDRFSFGGEYSKKLDFQRDDGNGLKFSEETVITVTGLNASTLGTAEFSARIVGYLL